MDYRGGRLHAGGTPVDLIYKRVLISELVAEGGLDHPVVRAVRDGAVCMVNPFRCKILHKKASLAVLSDERNATLFPPEELEAIRRLRPLDPGGGGAAHRHPRTSRRPAPFIAGHREQLVLKPNDDYGGAGIVLGWEVDAEAWAAALRWRSSALQSCRSGSAIPSSPIPA